MRREGKNQKHLMQGKMPGKKLCKGEGKEKSGAEGNVLLITKNPVILLLMRSIFDKMYRGKC